MLGLGRYLSSVVQHGYKRSAISPLLWLNALVTIPCLIGSFMIQDAFRWAPFSLAVIIVILTYIKYDYLVKKDPRLVQSESFQLHSHRLDIIAEKGGDILVNPVDLNSTTEPHALGYDDGEEDERD